MNMKVTSVEFPASALRKLGQDEQVFLVLLVRLLNEINILSKCIIIASSALANLTRHKETAQRVQALFFTRELAGKLWEGWELIRKSYFRSKLSVGYEKLLGDKGRDVLRQMREYFGRSVCPVRLIRNKHAFHFDAFDADVIAKELARLDRDDVETMVLADRGNSLYTFGEDITTLSILRLFDSDQQAAMDKMFREVAIQVPNWFQEFAADVLIAFVQKAAETTIKEEVLEEVPQLDAVRLPFFVTRPSAPY